MSAEQAARIPRLVVSHPVGERTGRVLAVVEGVLTVGTRRSTVRATLGARLLARVATDLGAAPRVGDRVRLRTWADGPVTVERVLARAIPAGEEEPGEASR